MTVAAKSTERFFGWRVVGATFVLAVFGLGIGFHGPAIYLHAVHEARGWPLPLVSAAVTVHFLTGAIVVANLPALYARFGNPAVTGSGALLLAVGVFGWAVAAAPWQLFLAAMVSGSAWVTMGVAAVNAIVSPWFTQRRPAALAVAYNGGNIGGVVFAPLWAVSIGLLGFPLAAAAIGLAMVAVMWTLAALVFTRTPSRLQQRLDDSPSPRRAAPTALPGARLWRDRRFLTLAAGMAIGLFAQIGLIVHLYSLLVPALGDARAGLAIALVTAMAVIGRTLIGWLMPSGADWRLVACASYGVQIVGSLIFIAAAGANVPLLMLGVILFGIGFGNGTWVPPLIAQAEFVETDVTRVVALIVAISQAAYAFAPAVFGLIRESSTATNTGAAPGLFAAAMLCQALAIAAFLAGYRRTDK